MFIAHLSDGSHFREIEDEKTWDDVPDIGVTSLQLTLPFSVKKPLGDGTFEDLPPATVTLSGYDEYYFMNEAVALVMVDQVGQIRGGQNKGEKVAQIIAGINRKLGVVLEIRVDKKGNVKHNLFSLTELESRFIDENRVGSFDPACIRKGK